MVSRSSLAFGFWVLAVAAGNAADVKPSAAQGAFFEKTIRPLLANQCYSCHGSEKQRGKLRLDSREAILRGGEQGPAALPGKPEESLLVRAISYKHELRMPPKTQLKPAEAEALVSWVKQGLPWPGTEVVRTPPEGSTFRITEKDRAFWAFQPVRNPPLPVVKAQQPQEPIDRFIQAAREAKGLSSVGPADKRTLLRRLTFDLVGLPPTPAEIDAFLTDDSPDGLARVIDRLLASPHFGERWVRHWLDVARYGEDQAHTFQARLYPNGYRYRDWLVKAYNDDLPYDRFLKEQIAADLLPENDSLANLPALGFIALGPVYYGDSKKLDQYDDRIDTLCRGILGLTAACARCHDHKFDPISTQDYYGLASVFASTDYAETPLVSAAEVEAARAKQTEDEKKKKAPLKVPTAHSLKDLPKPVTLRVHVRGNPDVEGEQAPRRFLSILGGEAKPFTGGSGRLELAEALASKDNPLTARVMVNRIWQHLFGKGLVRTPSNFGQLGERPTHPELLDHLASRFIAEGWSVKKLIRAIVLSETYRQGSGPGSEKALEIDPENRLLWRMNRRRLEVEAWRDAMLSVSGTLDPALGGPSLDLFAADNRRRTLYGKVSRHELNSLLRLFDFPDPNLTVGERTVTTVPLQQLFVLNSDFMVRNARAVAKRLSAAAKEDAGRVRLAFPLMYGRPATERELQLALAFLKTETVPAGAPGSPAQPGLNRWEQYTQVLLAGNEFLYID